MIQNLGERLNLRHFLLEHDAGFPGEVIFSKVWGSYSHNTQTEDSDVDYLGVYQSSNYEFLSLDRLTSTPKDSVVYDSEEVDYQFHEVGKFCSLLLKGNPGIVECLFTERMMERSPRLDGLWSMREMFLNKTTVRAYMGYAQGQLSRLLKGQSLHTTKGEYNTKWAYHLVRLLRDAERVASGSPPLVWKDTGDKERSILMMIRKGVWNQDQVGKYANEMITKIGTALEESSIPESADESQLSNWLYELRMRYGC